MKSTIVEATIGKLKYIFVTQGLLEWIMTFDNGSQFTTSDCVTLVEYYTQLAIAPYQPKSYGEVVETFKNIQSKYIFGWATS